jgi:CHAT domain-containing protein
LDNEIIDAEQSLTLKWQQLKARSFTPQEYTVLEQAEVQLKARIKVKHPKYYALKYPQPVDLATLQNQVLQKGEMMLVYGVLSGDEDIESKTILWVIGKQDFQMFTLPVDEDTLKQEVAQLRGYLFNPSFNRKFPQASLHLYQTLLPKAVRQLIKGAEILYIIPTGPLYGLPFGSLVTFYEARREIHYLIEDYAISYLSSASLLKTLRDEERKTQPPEPFLAFADPEYPPCGVGDKKGAETLAQLRTESYLKSVKDGCFTRLAATADEVRKIANLFNADHSKALYLGAKASRSTVFALNDKQELDDYRYVMFSVHGVIPNEINQIEQPALVLSNPLTEGYLTMADAFALTLNADFVNLSACNTGCAGESCSENVRGEGIMGLTRAFMYAGTSRVAVTLWSVNLYSAKELSIGLFTHLKAKKKMAYALR